MPIFPSDRIWFIIQRVSRRGQSIPQPEGGVALINYFRTVNDELTTTSSLEKGDWARLVSPTEAELQQVAEATGIAMDFLRYPLDDEERPRVELEENQMLIIIDVPVIKAGKVIYDTIPLGIVITNTNIVTVCLQDLEMVNDFVLSRVKGMATFKKTRFVFQLMQKTTFLYLKYLREINRKSDEIESGLHKAMRNKELIKLLDLEKSLVYFSTSLRSNGKVMERLLRTMKLYEEDEDLLEDVIIENKQAIEMADIYSNILTSTMGAFASIISNNLNMVMKFLAAVTIVVSMPTMVSSFFGMNVALPFQDHAHGFLIILFISLGLCAVSGYFLHRKNMF